MVQAEFTDRPPNAFKVELPTKPPVEFELSAKPPANFPRPYPPEEPPDPALTKPSVIKPKPPAKPSVDSFEPKLPIEIFPLEPSSITEPAKTNSAIQTNVHHAPTFPISTCQTKFQAEFTDRPPNAFKVELLTKPPDKAAELELLTKPPDNAAELKLPTKPPDRAAELKLPTKPPDKAAELELPTSRRT